MGAGVYRSTTTVFGVNGVSLPLTVNYTSSAVTQPIVSGTTNAGQSVSIFFNGATIATVTADSTGHWSYNATGLPDGANVLFVTASNGSFLTTRTAYLTLNASAPVEQAFRDVLGRGADAGSIAWGRSLLLNGTSLASLRLMLATSAEGVGRLQAYYQNVLGRGVDAAGLAYWQNQLANGASVVNMRSALAASAEGQAALNAVYVSVLHRNADTAGLAYHTAQLAAGTETLAGVAAVLATSPEAATRNQVIPVYGITYSDDLTDEYQTTGSDVARSDIEEIYGAVLGRTADDGDVSYWQSAAVAGDLTITDIRQAVATSSEAAYRIGIVYTDVLGRAADAASVPFWEDGLASGGTLAGLRVAIAGSTEASTALTAVYQDVLGRAPEPIGSGAWLVAIASGTNTLADVRSTAALSTESQANIAAAVLSGQGTAASATQIAAGETELLSGITLAQLQSLTSGIAAGTAVSAATTTLNTISATIQPGLITSGGTTTFLYGLPNNDILLASGARSVTASGGVTTISGFDIANDILQLPATQYGSVATLFAHVTATSGGAQIDLGGAGQVILAGITPSQLLPRDFAFA